jgi:hypothetical protein
MVDKPHFSPALTRLNGAHKPGCARADNDDIALFHMRLIAEAARASISPFITPLIRGPVFIWVALIWQSDKDWRRNYFARKPPRYV